LKPYPQRRAAPASGRPILDRAPRRRRAIEAALGAALGDDLDATSDAGRADCAGPEANAGAADPPLPDGADAAIAVRMSRRRPLLETSPRPDRPGRPRRTGRGSMAQLQPGQRLDQLRAGGLWRWDGFVARRGRADRRRASASPQKQPARRARSRSRGRASPAQQPAGRWHGAGPTASSTRRLARDERVARDAWRKAAARDCRRAARATGLGAARQEAISPSPPRAAARRDGGAVGVAANLAEAAPAPLTEAELVAVKRRFGRRARGRRLIRGIGPGRLRGGLRETRRGGSGCPGRSPCHPPDARARGCAVRTKRLAADRRGTLRAWSRTPRDAPRAHAHVTLDARTARSAPHRADRDARQASPERPAPSSRLALLGDARARREARAAHAAATDARRTSAIPGTARPTRRGGSRMTRSPASGPRWREAREARIKRRDPRRAPPDRSGRCTRRSPSPRRCRSRRAASSPLSASSSCPKQEPLPGEAQVRITGRPC
jgi:hypothetical protein